MDATRLPVGRDVDATRRLAVVAFFRDAFALDPGTARLVEAEVHSEATDEQSYVDDVRRLATSIRRNVTNAQAGACFKSDEELARGTLVETIREAERQRRERFERMLHEKYESIATNDAQDASLRCRRCKSTDVTWEQKQTQSADEGATSFCVCQSATCGGRCADRVRGGGTGQRANTQAAMNVGMRKPVSFSTVCDVIAVAAALVDGLAWLRRSALCLLSCSSTSPSRWRTFLTRRPLRECARRMAGRSSSSAWVTWRCTGRRSFATPGQDEASWTAWPRKTSRSPWRSTRRGPCTRAIPARTLSSRTSTCAMPPGTYEKCAATGMAAMAGVAMLR